MNFALLNFVLNAVRDSCPLVCVASSKIPLLLQNCVALIQVVKKPCLVLLFMVFLGHGMTMLCASK